MNERENFPADDAALPQIDSIEIIQLLGKGGMSLVYKARQMQLDRIVAVKVLSNLTIGAEDIIKRFQQEAKLTATLEHPNIVKTISFGVSRDGRPYLVMEYLDGLSLADEFKQNGRLRLQKFKDIFLPLLSALENAHQTGLVHRDIKPGNIMICRTSSGAETVKLLDFGIARVFGEGGNEAQNLTGTGVLLGTPSYMSPEQCQAKTLDGRSDLYSLSCVMYEALSGKAPFSGKTPLEVMAKHIDEAAPTVAELSRMLDIHKELAEAVVWAMAKDPASRPQSASEFAKKLKAALEQTTLDKLPCAKSSMAASGHALVLQRLSIALVLLVGTIGCTIYLDQKKIPLTVPLKVSANQKMEDRFERNFKDSLARIEKKHDPNSLEVAKQLDEMAGYYNEHQKYAQAEPLLERSLAIKQKAHLSDQNEVAALASIYSRQGKHEKEELLLKDNLASAEKKLGPGHPDLTTSLDSLATSYLVQTKGKLAEPLLERSLAISEKTKQPRVAAALVRLGESFCLQGNYAKADSLCKRAITIFDNEPGANQKDMADALFQVAQTYSYKGMYARAEPLYKAALSIQENLLGADDAAVALVMGYFANCYHQQGKYAEEERLLKRALAILENKLGPESPYVVGVLTRLRDCYRQAGKVREADLMQKRLSEINSP